MKNARVGVAGLLVGCLVCASAIGLHACGRHPEGSGYVITKMLATDINSGRQFYSIYVTEYEKDSNGDEVTKCYEVTEEEYKALQVGDDYTP